MKTAVKCGKGSVRVLPQNGPILNWGGSAVNWERSVPICAWLVFALQSACITEISAFQDERRDGCFVVRHSRLSCLQGIVKRDDDWYSSDSCLKETHDLKKEERAPMSRHEHGEKEGLPWMRTSSL